jgi:hypothetical protein
MTKKRRRRRRRRKRSLKTLLLLPLLQRKATRTISLAMMIWRRIEFVEMGLNIAGFLFFPLLSMFFYIPLALARYFKAVYYIFHYSCSALSGLWFVYLWTVL